MSEPIIFHGPYTEPVDIEWAKLRYGKCKRPPYIENDYWFIHVPTPGPYTFIVDSVYATPKYLGGFGHKIEEWSQVAQEVFIGDWDFKREGRWKDNPVYTYIFADGTVAKYGPCRLQAGLNCELWYLAIVSNEDSGNEPYDEAFIVESICIDHNFLERVGSNSEDWRVISYGGTRYFRAVEGARVDWNFENGPKDMKVSLLELEKSRITLQKPLWLRIIQAFFQPSV